MMSTTDYRLLDFGAGRKLERFGDQVIDRPAPAAHDAKQRQPSQWSSAHWQFQRGDRGGRWRPDAQSSKPWTVRFGDLVFELKLAPEGQVGVFPEQAENWQWIARQVRAAGRPLHVLNLFAYTGGATLAAARAGASVTHVDAAKSAVAWARRNAELSGLRDKPIRWIVEDVPKYLARERKRGRRYDAVIFDPPSYGHGPRGETWKLSRHLTSLLDMCRESTAGQMAFVLITCHTPGYGPAELEALLADRLLGSCQAGARSRRLQLSCADGRRLPSGAAAYWP